VLQNYRDAQKELKRAIEKSKNKSSELRCKQVDLDPWGHPYKIVSKKLIGRKLIPGRMEAIVEKLFPSKNEITGYRPQERNLFPEITPSEIIDNAKRIPLGKAPGERGAREQN